MLDRSKLTEALQGVSTSLFAEFAQEIDIAKKVWLKIASDDDFEQKVSSKQQSLLIPSWQGQLGQKYDIAVKKDDYCVLAVDGSQIYYDKHQGPPCYLINTGFVQLSYGSSGGSVKLHSEPKLFTKLNAENGYGSTDFINMQREFYEFEVAWNQMQILEEKKDKNPSLCLFDGTLIFFNLDSKDMQMKEKFLNDYCNFLDQFYQKRLLIAGYVSLPKNKELVNLCKLELSQFDQATLEHTSIIDRLTDIDIAEIYLKPLQRSTIFKSRAPIAYLYPKHLRPYFCYLHVGSEIARIEFPQWIASSVELVDLICGIAIDQAEKGKGYPVCLFEAHEQAVIKSADRQFFYQMVEKMSQRKSKKYLISQKSVRKQQPIV